MYEHGVARRCDFNTLAVVATTGCTPGKVDYGHQLVAMERAIFFPVWESGAG